VFFHDLAHEHECLTVRYMWPSWIEIINMIENINIYHFLATVIGVGTEGVPPIFLEGGRSPLHLQPSIVIIQTY